MTWAHATNSRNEFEEAVASTSVKAIECDIMMNRNHPPEPILSHPPSRKSDLMVRQMVRFIVAPHEGEKDNLRKHLKLDFKEIEALEPTLDLILDSDFTNTLRNEIFLNADILSGPGFDEHDPSIVSPSMFLETSLSYIQRLKTKNPEILFGFSLGFKCNWKSDEGYSASQVSRMSDLVNQYQLASTNSLARIVLALNARQLSKSLSVFDVFLRDYPESTILAWTGSGEPAIPKHEVDKIGTYYESKMMVHRVEFDCCIER
mmetsp:Transcript_20677/g.51335  ORF Transcript_20677/g.51335 Transcript_20677/m.51335 type:complete len:261 (+) Transcript_20677:156-938(+)